MKLYIFRYGLAAYGYDEKIFNFGDAFIAVSGNGIGLKLSVVPPLPRAAGESDPSERPEAHSPIIPKNQHFEKRVSGRPIEDPKSIRSDERTTRAV
jgi:hypothetical protein